MQLKLSNVVNGRKAGEESKLIYLELTLVARDAKQIFQTLLPYLQIRPK